MDALSQSLRRKSGFQPATTNAARLPFCFVFTLLVGTWMCANILFAGTLRGAGPRDPVPSQPSEAAESGVAIELQRPSDPSKMARFAVRLNAAEVKALSTDEARSRDWSAVFSITVVRDGESAPLAMLGTYRIEGDQLLFVPRFPLRPSMTYRATFRAGDGRTPVTESRVLVKEFTLARPQQSPPTDVAEVYPTRDVLPENQLKFYIHFSSPMSRGEAYQHIRLVRAPGNQIEDPFLELGEELWNRDGTRFTLFFDPGRIKRGLKPREEVGPALEEGHCYTLIIDGGWRDAKGRALTSSYRKEFRVVAPDDTQPQPSQWRFECPAAGSRDELTVTFDEPLDHAMLQRVLSVDDSDGRTLEGEVAVDGEETIWRFAPEQPWMAGSYRLVIETALEDLAGNSLARPFEIDVFRPLPKTSAQAKTTIPFQIEPATTSAR